MLHIDLTVVVFFFFFFFFFFFDDLPVIEDAKVYASGQALICHDEDGAWIDTQDIMFDGTDADMILKPAEPDMVRRVRDALQLHRADDIAERIAANLDELRAERRVRRAA